MPGPIGQPLAVGRHRGTEPGPVSTRQLSHRPGFPVVGPDLILGKNCVVVPVTGPGREPDVAAVGTERGAEGLEIRRLGTGLDQGKARATVDRIQLQLGRREGAAAPAHHEVLAVGRPLGRDVLIGVALGHLGRVGFVERHGEEVVPAAPVGDEGDLLSVGAESRLGVERQPGHEGGGLPAADRQSIDIAEQVEHNGLTIGTHVQGHPGALGGGEFRLPLRLERQGL